MFSGIIEERAQVCLLEQSAESCRLGVRTALDLTGTRIGDSIAVDGVCLTVVRLAGAELFFDVSAETLRRSTLAQIKVGAWVNVERALKVGERIAGHLVSGHVDAAIVLLSKVQQGASWRLTWSLPADYRSLIAEKGCVALGGVSLTVGEMGADYFAVYVIPHTLAVTTLGLLQPGDQINLEADLLARYVQSVLSNSGERSGGGVSWDLLEKHGYLKDGR